MEISNLKEEKDLEIIAEEYANYYSNSVLEEKWTKESAIKLFKYFYKSAPDLFFVAYDNSNPVGVITTCLKPWWDGMHLEDGELFVCKEYQKKGIAKKLFKTLLEYAIDKYDATILEAHTYEDENGFPYSWYKRVGFKTVDDLKIISGNIKDIVNKLWQIERENNISDIIVHPNFYMLSNDVFSQTEKRIVEIISKLNFID